MADTKTIGVPDLLSSFSVNNIKEYDSLYDPEQKKVESKPIAVIPAPEVQIQLQSDNSLIKEDIMAERFAEPEVEARDYSVASPLDFNKPIEMQQFLMDNGYDIGAKVPDGNVGSKTRKSVQKFLVDRGYNIGQGELKEPIDGIIGRRTKNAIANFNDKVAGNNSKYRSPYKDDFLGALGLTNEEEDQCSKTTQCELSRNTNISREDLRLKYGVYGDAWDMPNNVVKAGGEYMLNAKKKIDNKQNLLPGDIVNFFTGGHSVYQSEAGDGNPTHVGIIDSEVIEDKNGKKFVYVVDNVHSGNKYTGFVGHKFRKKMYLNNEGNAPTMNGWRAVNIARPNLHGDGMRFTADPNVKIMTDKQVPQVAQRAMSVINDVKTKEQLMNDLRLGEEDFNSISLAALGIIGQETGYGERGKFEGIDNAMELRAKEIASSTVKTIAGIAKYTPTGALLKAAGMYPNEGEASVGYSRIKFDTNFANNAEELKGGYGITEKSLYATNDDGSKAMIAAVYVLGKNYEDVRRNNPEMSKDEALYLAIQKYNRYSLSGKYGDEKKSSYEYATNRDLAYPNKALAYASMFKAHNGKAKVSTGVDRLNKDDRIVEKQIPFMIENGMIDQDKIAANIINMRTSTAQGDL